uniref:Histidine kinase/HSP90-like ATPase domain-containing protein n=1 Tax=Rhinopithecus bieti TaxID=61621 RepID=A0A2K6KGP1_RHIBE
MARELRALLLWGRRLRPLLRAPALAAAPGGKPILCPRRTTAQLGPRRNLAWSFQAGRLLSTQSAEDKEEPLHSIISSTESVQGSVSKHEFPAETKKLLDVVALKEVFIRELISNASDALENSLPEMEIHLQTDAEKGTITIQDTGIGMTQEELVSNLGTIARSGSKAFLDTLQNQAEASSKIIGQFGVGFYSAFMVADRVEVYSRSAAPESPGYRWLSDGSGVFEIAEASGDKPRYTLHYKTDAPLNIRSLFYVPDTKPSMFDVSRELGSSVALYSRKVLIQTKATDILPKWLRFIRGVVNSEDIPLNLSRELLQESMLIRKLRDVLQQRLIKFFIDQSKKDFFEDYGLFMREGIVTTTEQEVKVDIAKLLRYESSVLPTGQFTSLSEYASRMQAGTRNIYYLRHLSEHSPYYEAMKKKDTEVLFGYEQFDELTLLHLREFDKKQLISVETDIVVDHYKEEKFEDGSPAAERLSEKETEELMAWMRNVLGSRVTNVKVTLRLDTHPAMVTVPGDGGARHFLRMQQLAKTHEERPTLEITPAESAAGKRAWPWPSCSVDQIYENAHDDAGLLTTTRAMVGPLNECLSRPWSDH